MSESNVINAERIALNNFVSDCEKIGVINNNDAAV